ncbi:filamentous hemagglutinin N-terminal domain-containing protein [Moorena producens]|uniref:two-partner secretion domain-containing protein n=1 Tax=Moorena producens TaxID=1155739 RepID=UPI003C715A3D
MITTVSDQYLLGKSWALTAFVLSGATLVTGESVLAQIIPDNTLKQEKSVVTPLNSQVDRIDGGAIRGTNLFHSFQNFSIPEGSGVYFSNPAGVETIFSRVTGSNTSDIYGTLGVLGDANLFLLNPNGILFGPNARLDLKGSFVASTANSVTFPEGSTFSATNPKAPPLLTVDVQVPIGLQFEGEQPRAIVNAGNLEVAAGQNLTLVGGTVVSTGELLVPSGEIAVVSVPGVGAEGEMSVVQLAQAGQVLSQDNKLLPPDSSPASLSIVSLPEVIMEWGENTGLTVSSEGQVKLAKSSLPVEAGDVVVQRLNAQTAMLSATENLTLVESQLTTGGDVTLLADSDINISSDILTNGGNVTIKSFGDVSFNNKSQLSTSTFGEGNAGNINIESRSLTAEDGTQLQAGTFREGNAGSIKITAKDAVSFRGEGSFVKTLVGIGAIGNGGDISIDTSFLELTNGVQVSAQTFGEGNTGNISINATDVKLIGEGSGVGTLVGTGAIGNGGDIKITTSFLELTNGAQINSSTFGRGNAGNILIQEADSVVLESSFIGSVLGKRAIALQGSNIDIQTHSLSLNNGSSINSSTIGRGDAGNISVREADSVVLESSSIGSVVVGEEAVTSQGSNIDIQTNSLSLNNGSRVSTNTFGRGDAGNIFVREADSVVLDSSFIFAGVGKDAVTSQASNIDIQTNSLSLNNGSRVSTNTLGRGDGGNIFVREADSVVLDNSFISAGVSKRAIALQGGNIDIQTHSLSLNNGSSINSNTFGRGNAGNIVIKEADSVVLDSSSIGSVIGEEAVTSQASNIDIQTNSLSLNNGSILSTTTFGQGDAGNIVINANEIVSLESSSISAAIGKAAISSRPSTIDIQTDSVILTNNSLINAATAGKGDAGQILVRANEAVSLEDSSITNNLLGTALTSKPGKIDIQTNLLSLTENSGISASNSGQGNSGNIFVRADEAVSLDNSFILTDIGAGAVNLQPSDISIQTNSLSLNNLSVVSADTSGSGDAGSIFIEGLNSQVADSVNLSSSGISTNVSSLGEGQGGDIRVKASSVNLINDSSISAETFRNNGGNITIEDVQNLLLLRHGSQISTTAGIAGEGGNGGNITIDARDGFIVAVPSENSDITANAFLGNGGNVRISTQRVFGIQFRPAQTGFSDITATSDFGLDGNVEVEELGVDPTRGLTVLPDEPRSTDVAEGCQATDGQDTVQFYDIGRGGSPPRPDEPLNADTLITEWIPLDFETADVNGQQGSITPKTGAIRTAQIPITTFRLMPPCQSR